MLNDIFCIIELCFVKNKTKCLKHIDLNKMLYYNSVSNVKTIFKPAKLGIALIKEDGHELQ